MDDIVKQAMVKWPNVPDCYGWLGLDARGDWYMRDDRTQAIGTFCSGLRGAKGSRLVHDKLIAFIGRNYASDVQGNWYFQNGPQRVYVELEATPWVWRMQPDGGVQSHTGYLVTCERALTDERGWLYLQTSLGFGVVHTQDVAMAAEKIESGQWPLEEIRCSELPQRFGFIVSPDSNRQPRTG